MRRRAGGSPQKGALTVKESDGLVIINDNGRKLDQRLPDVTTTTRMSIGGELWIVMSTF